MAAPLIRIFVTFEIGVALCRRAAFSAIALRPMGLIRLLIVGQIALLLFWLSTSPTPFNELNDNTTKVSVTKHLAMCKNFTKRYLERNSSTNMEWATGVSFADASSQTTRLKPKPPRTRDGHAQRARRYSERQSNANVPSKSRARMPRSRAISRPCNSNRAHANRFPWRCAKAWNRA